MSGMTDPHDGSQPQHSATPPDRIRPVVIGRTRGHNTNTNTMIKFNESYDKPAQPQQIRDDFAQLTELSDPAELLRALAGQLDADTLAAFIDDRLMGRV